MRSTFLIGLLATAIAVHTVYGDADPITVERLSSDEQLEGMDAPPETTRALTLTGRSGQTTMGASGSETTAAVQEAQPRPGSPEMRLEVVDGDGAPVSGAMLTLAPSWANYGQGEIRPAPSRCTSGPDGRASVELAWGERYHVVAVARGFAIWEGDVTAGASHAVRVVLDRGRRVRGRVFGLGGRPLGFVTVALLGRNSFTTQTDEQGRFDMTGLPARSPARLGLTKPGYATVIVTVSEGGDVPVDVFLAPGQRIDGWIVDRSGLPVGGVLIRIAGFADSDGVSTHVEAVGWLSDRREAHTRSDSDGRFRFEDLARGRYELQLRRRADSDLYLTVDATAPDGALAICLDPAVMRGVEIRGRVFDAASLQPIHGFRLTPLSCAGNLMHGQPREVDSTDGSFVVVGLKPGRIQLRFEAQGYAEGIVATRDYVAGRHQIRVHLHASCTALLRIQDASGRPVDREVAFLSSDGQRLGFRDANGAPRSSMRSGPRGRVTASGLPLGHVTVELRKRGVKKCTRRRIWIGSNSPIWLVVD